MKSKWFVIGSIILIVLCLFTVQAGAITVERQKMIIDVPRILHGAKNGYEFFGPDRARIQAVHNHYGFKRGIQGISRLVGPGRRVQGYSACPQGG